MSSYIDTQTILYTPPRDVAQHLRDVLQSASIETVTQDLLFSVERGSIPPAIFTIWLGVSRSPIPLKVALEQNVSVEIRKIGIKRLKKNLKSSDWRVTWQSLGDLPGLLTLIADLSVQDVRAICGSLGHCAKGTGQEVAEKREKITQLLEALLPGSFSDSAFGTRDERPLRRYYQRIAPACTPELITAILSGSLQGEWGDIHRKDLLLYHSDTLREMGLRDIFSQQASNHSWLWKLFQEYPSETGTYHRFSASMQFSLDVLRLLAREEKNVLSEHEYLSNIVLPLLRRALRKRIEWPRSEEISTLAVAYLGKHFHYQNDSNNRERLLQFIALCWSRRPEMFEKQFSACLALCYKRQKSVQLGSFETLLKGVRKTGRYPLLRFCYKEVADRDIDIEADLRGSKGTLSWSLLERLEAEQALGLFTRLRTARGDHDLVQRGPYHSVTHNGHTLDGVGGDPLLFQVVLLSRNGKDDEANVLALQQIKELQQKAIAQSDQSLRAWYAHSVLYYAYASGSCKLVRDSLLWARRFNRDTLTLASLYEHYPDEAKAIFCAIPTLTENIDYPTIQNRIQEANAVLTGLFAVACETLREPSFNLNYWTSTFRLYLETVLARMKRLPDLREANFDEDMIYRAVWVDTLRLITYIDEESLKSGHERLGLNKVGGILATGKSWYGSDTCSLPNHYTSTYRFLDQLAEARDKIWRAYRLTQHPAVTTLPDHYPRGLPIQHLTGPLFPRTKVLDKVAPYLADRARQVVYLETAKASQPVPKDGESLAAIERYIDDYWYALLILIPDVVIDVAERKKSVETAWAHALDSLSAGRMTPSEADRYWRYTGWHYVQTWPRSDERIEQPVEWPIIPSISDPIMAEEWDPRPTPVEAVKPRLLDQATYIDICKNASVIESSSNPLHALKEYRPQIPGRGREEDPIWSWSRIAKARKNFRIREGQVISALLYLDVTNLSKNRLLASPFPAVKDVRYPSLYLDDQFLSANNLSIDSAFDVLQVHAKYIPPRLLEQLALNAMDKLESTDPKDPQTIILQSTAFRAVKLLGKSDRPSLATQLAIRTIIHHPGASSWHRQILAPSMFRRLSASDARECFNAFATAIITTLEEQEKAKKAREEKEERAKRFVKVTTVKFLAQLLRDTEFVSEDFSIDVLSTLAQKASHIDVKKAVLESLLNMFQTSPPALSEKIFVALEGIIPLAGTLNERQPISESDWKAAEASNTVPEIEINRQESAPMLKMLLDFCHTAPRSFSHRTEYLNRIIIPLLTQLKQQMKRWVTVFLASSSVSSGELDNLPLVPRSPDVWKALLQYNFSYTPVSILEEYVNWQLFCIKPPLALAALNKTFHSTPELRWNPAVQTWVSLYPAGPAVLDTGNGLPLPSLLGRESALSEEDGAITSKHIQTFFLNIFTATLWTDAPKYYHLNTLANLLKPASITQLNKHWLEYKKPLVEAIILYVDSLRTRDWDRDANRQPAVLPDTFSWRLWLLKYPGIEGLEGDQDERCETFAQQVSKLLDQVSGGLYHSKYAAIKEYVNGFVAGADRLVVGVYLGDISKTRLSWLSLQDLLRVEVAWELMRETRSESRDLRDRVQQIMLSWRLCDNEEVRRMGYSLNL
ncbi:hypothetical protein K491DRAFT_597002 [Lophiostoma macrostomum CBS 122681]|uniref:Uncharacterized protein n=1 Tax=Lophiostoma macrostomum CBS 122681 TaxID=1314788 RepID=A0A6A6TCW1_9PLEO|nr:hypothetical protein K491DRAFT_597002 [Lophiostoma macrostomum CBS 122681]